jgi:hypothetical protein
MVMNIDRIRKLLFPQYEERITNVEYHQIPLTEEFLKNTSRIIELTQPVYTKTPLIRIGRNGDGGYVIAPEFESKVCLTLGVGSEVSADIDLIEKGFKLFAFDGTVLNPLPETSAYRFEQKNIGYGEDSEWITDLERIFAKYPLLEQADLIMIDIEGHEYRVFEEEIDLISKSKQIVVEFHGLELLGDQLFSKRFIKILEELLKTHAPIHVHGNNSGGTLAIGGASWPTILEVTFLAKDHCILESNYGPFPTRLDFPNSRLRPDVELTCFYGKTKTFSTLSRTILNIQ